MTNEQLRKQLEITNRKRELDENKKILSQKEDELKTLNKRVGWLKEGISRIKQDNKDIRKILKGCEAK